MNGKSILLLLFGAVMVGCAQHKAENNAAAQQETSAPAVTASDTMQTSAVPMHYMVKISTDYGDMEVKLYDETPKHRDNFVKLVKSGFFDGLLFHRVINGFMIQGGDPDSRDAKPGQLLGNGGPGYTIPAEFRDDLFHKKGALAAAREGDAVNPEKASSGSQFYIVQGKKYTDEELDALGQKMQVQFSDEQRKTYREAGGTPFLDHNYTVFGEVVSGLDVIDKIASVQTDDNNRPLKDIHMHITMEPNN